MSFPALDVTAHIAPIWLLPASVAVLAFAAWSYRHTLPPVSPLLRALLAGLRAAALLLVLALAVGLRLHWSGERPLPTRTALLLDGSESMGFGSGSDDRRSQAMQALEQLRLLPGMDERIELTAWHFAEELRPGAVELPAADGAATNLAGALEALALRSDPPPDAVILLSDGTANRGGSIDQAARSGRVPVLAVAVGDSQPPTDLVVRSVAAPATGYAGEAVPVDITLRATGLEGREFTVLLRDRRGAVLERRRLRIDRAWSEQSLRFEVTPDSGGLASWSVEVDSLAGEIDSGNNRRRVAMQVQDRRRSVLLVAPAASADVAALARALEDDPDTEPTIFIGTGRSQQLLRGRWGDLEDPQRYDAALIIAEGQASQRLERSLGELLASPLPLFILLGEGNLSRTMRELLQPRLGQLAQHSFAGAEAVLVPVGEHPLHGERGWLGFGGDVPPLTLASVVPRGAETLAVARVDGNELPLLAVTQSQPRSLVLYAGGLWRWELGSRPRDPSGSGWRGFHARLLRWLTTGEQTQRIIAGPSRDLFDGGEAIELTATVRDEAMQPVETATVTAELSHAGRRRTVELRSLGGGRYAGEAQPWGEGRYEIETTVEAGQEIFRRSSSAVVDEFHLEAAERRARPELLRAAAQASGGAYVHATETDSLARWALKHLPLEEGSEAVRGSWQPFGRWLTLLLAAALLGLEWLIRTRLGMV